MRRPNPETTRARGLVRRAAGIRLATRLLLIDRRWLRINLRWLLKHRRWLRIGGLSVVVAVIRSPTTARAGHEEQTQTNRGPFHRLFPSKNTERLRRDGRPSWLDWRGRAGTILEVPTTGQGQSLSRRSFPTAGPAADGHALLVRVIKPVEDGFGSTASGWLAEGAYRRTVGHALTPNGAIRSAINRPTGAAPPEIPRRTSARSIRR